MRAYGRAQYRRHKPARLAAAAAYRRSAEYKAWLKSARRPRLRYNRRWRKNNPAKLKAQWRTSYRRNRDKHLEKVNVWRRRNPAKRKQQKQRYHAKHRKKILARLKRWAKKNATWLKLYKTVASSKRRAMLAAAVVGDQSEVRNFYKEIRNAARVLCHWCGKRIPKGRRTIDHIHPICRKGAHSRENLVPACKGCNSAKGAKTAEEFMRDSAALGRRLAVA